MLAILYWIILILAAIGIFVPSPWAPRMNSVCLAILFVLLGLRVFHVPLQ